MKDDFNDNELDRAFRQGMEDMEITPSDSFWSKSESGILGRENISIRKDLFRWKLVAASFALIALSSVFYIFFFQNKLQEPIATLNSSNAAIHGSGDIDKIGPGFSPDNKTSPVSLEGQLAENNTIPSEKIVVPIRSKQEKPIFVSENNASASLIALNPVSVEKNENTAPPEEVKMITTSENSLTAEVKEKIASDSTRDQRVENTNQDTQPTQSATSASSSKPALLSRFSFSGFFSPSIANQFLKDNDNGDDLEEDELDEIEEDQISYSAGIQIGYDLNSTWSVQTGCSYLVSSFNINPTLLFAKPGAGGQPAYTLVTSSGTVAIPSDDSTPIGDTLSIGIRSKQTLSFITIPLQFIYRYPVKRFIFYASAGVSGNILADSQTNLNYEDDPFGDDDEDDTFENIEGLKDIHFGFSVGAGARFMLSRKFFLSAEPSFSGALTAINKNVPVQSRPYFWGLGIGFGYHF